MLDAGKKVTHSVTAGRRIFIYLTEGEIAINNEMLMSKDQARVHIDQPLVLQAKQRSDLILIDVPSCKGWSYCADTLKGRKK